MGLLSPRTPKPPQIRMIKQFNGSRVLDLTEFMEEKVMKKRYCLTMILALSAAVLVGCSTSNSSTTSVPAEPTGYMGNKSDSITKQGKADFASLTLEEDDFTKESYYNLPEKEQAEVKFNDMYFSFFLYKAPESNNFMPAFSLTYYGKDWLFMESAIFKVNEDVMTFIPDVGPDRDPINGYPSEWLAFYVTDEKVNFLGQSKSNSDLEIRVNTKTYKETKLTLIEYKGLKKILSAYRYLESLK